jgi:hypothetical protein
MEHFSLLPILSFLPVVDLPRRGFTKNWIYAYDFKTPDGYSFTLILNRSPMPN